MVTSKLKSGYKLLYYIALFGILFNFMLYPAYAVINEFPYGHRSNIYYHFVRPDGLYETAVEHEEQNISKVAETKNKVRQSFKQPEISVTESKETAAPQIIEILSNDHSGVIGYGNTSNSDDPADNIFSFNFEKSILADKEIRISYEIFGVENISGVSRSINENNATGGYVVKTNNKWNTLEETISPEQLKDGINHLIFTAFHDKRVEHEIKNVRIVGVEAPQKEYFYLADNNTAFTKNNKAYVKGSVLVPNVNLYINNVKIPIHNGAFEAVIPHDSHTKSFVAELVQEQQILATATVNLIPSEESLVNAFKKRENSVFLEKTEENVFSLDSDDVTFKIDIENYKRASDITVQKLRAIDMPPLGTNIINVTSEQSGYRFLPEGAKFDTVTQLGLKFNPELLPSGYTAHDVKILYFDLDKRRWLSIPTDSILVDKNKIVGLTDHFTDYIAGIIQSPESPETASFTPTSISDIQVADPTANIVQIQPPTANQKGDGTLDFPIVVPAGRHGMQPNLSVSYNNNGSSGIAGYGWDIAIPNISVDVKFGVAEYISNKESESYLLNGEELMLVSGNDLYLPHRSSATINRLSGTVTFVPKVESSFSKIQRNGNQPSNYTWTVWDKAGTKYFYGQTANSRLAGSSGNIAKWMLSKVEDKNGNYMTYNYVLKNYTTGNLAGGKELLVNSIIYSMNDADPALTPKTVYFNYNNETRSDANFNYRYGFKVVDASSLASISVEIKSKFNAIDYQFHYKTGRFEKKLLDSIETINYGPHSGSAESYVHSFEYYDDISADLFGAEQTISTGADLADEISVVSGTVTKDFLSGSINVGAGVYFPAFLPSYIPVSYAGTANFNFPLPSSYTSKPSVSLFDIDGDGLPDKVVKKGDSFKYRKNIGAALFSSELYPIYNFKELSATRNTSKSDPSVSLALMIATASFSNSTTNSESNTFLTDVNADGLIDYVHDRIVYFNRMDPNSGLPTFTDNSNLTPNRIFKEGDVDPAVLAPLPDLTLGNDLMDVVKVWVAPKSGTINISGTISKNFVSSDNGVRFSIEKSYIGLLQPNQNIENSSENIQQGAYFPFDPYFSTYLINPSLLVVNSMPTTVTNVSVTRGTHIYFRVNSSQQPSGPVQVNWDPQITYVTEDFPSVNQYQQYSSKYSDSFLYGNSLLEPILLNTAGPHYLKIDAFNINNSATIAELSDDVFIKATLFKAPDSNGNVNETVIWSQHIKRNLNNSIGAQNIFLNTQNIDEDDPATYYYLKIEAFTDSQINWKKFDTKFKPRVVNSLNEAQYVIPFYESKSGQLTNFYQSVINATQTVTIKHNFALSNCTQSICENQYVYMVVKDGKGKIPSVVGNAYPAKFRYKIAANGTVVEIRQFNNIDYTIPISTTTSQITAGSGNSYYFEYYADSYSIASRLNTYQEDYNNLLTSSLTGSPKSLFVNGTTNTGLYKANIFYRQNLQGIGTLYRNWGQFAYKGALPNQNFEKIKRRHIGILAMAGITSEDPTEEELGEQSDFVENFDPSELEYDHQTGTFTGNAGVSYNSSQIEALQHFTMLKPDRLSLNWKSHNNLFVAASTMAPFLRYDIGDTDLGNLNIPAPQGVGVNGAVSIVRQSTSSSNGKTIGTSFIGLSYGHTTSKATSTILNDYQDVNGDGYPDIIGQQVQLTSKRGGLSNNILNQNLLFGTSSDGSGNSISGSPAVIALEVLESATKIRIGDATSGAGSLGGNEFTTNTESAGILMDINGDGLADQVRNDGVVELNTGQDFLTTSYNGYDKVSSMETKLGGANAGGSFAASSNLDFSLGIAGSSSTTKVLKEFMDVNGDGLVDYISNGTILINTGTSFVNSNLSLPNLSESVTREIAKAANLSILFQIPIFLVAGLKVGGGGGVSLADMYTDENIKYLDFDGDGYVDRVVSGNDESLKVRLSNIKRTNMLKKVYNPTGSQIKLDYATYNKNSNTQFGPTYKMPFKKWVLSDVEIYDGFESDGADTQSFSFEYKNGLKDRRERKFLGFGEVKTHQMAVDGSVYRTKIQEYYLNTMQSSEMYLPGIHSDSRKYQYIGDILKKEVIIDEAQRILNTTTFEHVFYNLGTTAPTQFTTSSQPQVVYTDNARILPLMKKSESVVKNYEGNSLTNFLDDINISEIKKYDAYGNVIAYKDVTDGIDVTIDYYLINSSSAYIANVPKTHTVTSNGTEYRKSSTVIDTRGNILKISRHNGNVVSTTDYQYNVLGNLIKVTFPKPNSSSSESERMFYTYEYDPAYKQYVSQVADAYGLKSHTEYTNFGLVLKQSDANQVDFFYTYDSSRRLIEFKGPYNKYWTIRHTYKTDVNTGLKYAVTEHNLIDEQTGDNDYVLHTSSFADGLGRIIQTKKQLDTEHLCNGISGYRFSVSGLQKYDEFGRVVESNLGQEEFDCNGDFFEKLTTFTSLQSTLPEKTTVWYDGRDRVVQNHVHGLNATTNFDYGFNNDAYNNTRAYEKVTLPEGNISYTYKDAKGRVTSTKQVNQNSGEILNTKYTYNVIGELLTVTDAEDKQTKYQYDLFGQKKSVLHPDNGTTVFEYDLAGKLISHANQNLINAGQEIKYEYEFNRLTTIYYPSHKVTYIYGGTSGSNEQYSLGRIARVVDLTGNKRVSYGALGEVLFEARDVQSNVGSMVFETRFRYDSWGRILEMQYPDGEQLRYTYNSTGQLKAIFNNKGESYLKDVEYNFFDQPTKIVYGNEVVTTNEYDITQRIRAMQLDRPDTTSFLRNLYSYDRNQNITEINNESSQHNTIRLGGVYNKTYTYDAFNRLATANGSWTGFEEAHNYSLDLRYSATHGIKRKAQFHEASDLVTSHETPHSYRSDYEYDDIDHPHAVSTIHYSNHNNQPKGKATFKYDDNGNMKYYHSDVEDAFMKREFIWDEQNRLMAVIDLGERISHYVYDHAGERTFKSEGYVSQVNIAGQQIYTAANFDEYIIYPSGYLVVNPSKNEYSKHYYINGKRFVSRLDKLENLMSGNLVAETDPIKTESELIRDLKTAESIDLTNSVLSFVPGNTDANCTAQLNALIANYTANNNPPTASLQHCIDILNGYKNTLPPCEALVKANEYICEPVDLTSPGNIPIITLPPNYNEDELEQFDCLTVLNTILAEYSGLMVNVLGGYPETTRDIYICARACASNPAGTTNCVLDFEQTGVWSEACIELLRDCGCMPPGYDCYREVVLYIQNNLVLEPVSNACEVLQYVLNNFDCAPDIILPVDPQTPGDIDDDWNDEGGNDGIPQEDYDEAQRKPIWWYHTDHLGSSTYLTDNFGRPSHYYETLPFGEMMVE
ncbi:MAG: hypothetical protein KIG55_05860, partial [Myroides sp.]|nr:hypothetical protein [Myroides sp.]